MISQKIHKFNQITLAIDKELEELFEKEINLFLTPTEISENAVVSMIWDTAGDDRVCPLCSSLSGQIFPVESAEFGRLEPPIHSGCRCFLRYQTGRQRGIQERLKEYRPVDPELLTKWSSKIFTDVEIREMARNVSEHTVLGDKLKEFTDKYKGYKTEKVLVLDVNGKPITFINGTEKSFTIPGKTVALLKNRNLILIHNHPNGASFSPADIMVANAIKFKEIHIVTTKYHYIIYPKEPNNWPTSRYLLDLRFRSEVGKMTIQDAWDEYTHKIWQIISKEFDLIYERIPI